MKKPLLIRAIQTICQEKSLAFIPLIDKHFIHFAQEKRDRELPKRAENSVNERFFKS
jgi:hypothetical protein